MKIIGKNSQKNQDLVQLWNKLFSSFFNKIKPVQHCVMSAKNRNKLTHSLTHNENLCWQNKFWVENRNFGLKTEILVLKILVQNIFHGQKNILVKVI